MVARFDAALYPERQGDDLPIRPAPTDLELELDHEAHLRPEPAAHPVCLYFLADAGFAAHTSGDFEQIGEAAGLKRYKRRSATASLWD